MGQGRRFLPVHGWWWEHVRHHETRTDSKWRGRGRRGRWGGRGARWRLGGKCGGGEGRRRCGGGWGWRRELPRGTVVATDASDRGEQLDREGEHLLPTCRVREGRGGHMQTSARCRGQVAWQDGMNSSADRSKWRRSSPEVFQNACRCEIEGGTKGGTRRTCRSAERCARKTARRRGSALATRLATATTSAASVVDRPPTKRISGFPLAPAAAC